MSSATDFPEDQDDYVGPEENVERLLVRVRRLELHWEFLRGLLVDALPYLENHCDAGPSGEGWQSDRLVSVIQRIKDVTGETDA